MKLTPTQPRALILVAVLTAWVVGLFFLPARVWLEPFSRGPTERLAGPLTVPAADARPGRTPLGQLDFAGRQSSLLALKAPSGGAFSLQVKDPASGQVIRTLRFSPRDRTTVLLVALDSRRMPEHVRLTLWNRERSDLKIESAEVLGLSAAYRWAQPLYRIAGPLLLILWAWVSRRDLSRYLGSDEPLNGDSPRPRWDGLVAALVFLFCFSVFRLAPVHQLLDSKFMSAVSHSFLATGSVALVDDFVPSRNARQRYTLRPVGEKTYHFFSSAPAVLNAPIVALFELSGVSSVAADGRYLGHNEHRILRLIAAFLAATLCTVLFLTARIWVAPGRALGLTLAFAFGTQIFSTISRPFWSHSWATLLLASALLILAAPRFRDRRISYVLISTLLCWAYFCRPPLSLSILGITVFIFLQRRRFLLPFVTTGGVWGSLFVFCSLKTYQSILPPYFLSSHLESGRLAGGLLLTSYPEAMMGTLFSPGRGFLVYVPMIAVILFVVVRRWRWLPDKGLAATALGVCLAHWQLVSMFRNWWGGQSFGPRLMSDLLPWMFLLAALGIAALAAASAEGRLRWKKLKSTGVALIVAASIFINSRGAFVQETQRGAGVWNWRYPQFLAGLLPRPDTPNEPDGPSE